MHTNIVPRTFSAGLPQVVVCSTSGSVRPMAATGANGSARRLATARVYADRGDQRAHGVDDHLRLVEVDPVAALRGDQVAAARRSGGEPLMGRDFGGGLMRLRR